MHLNRQGLSPSEYDQWKFPIAHFGDTLDPTDAMTFNNLGIIRRDYGQFQQAIQDFTNAIQADPEYPFSYANRALCNALIGEDAKVEADIKRAVALGLDQATLEEGILAEKKRRLPAGSSSD